jgi:cobalamin biosynthesis protein CobD/CbiB
MQATTIRRITKNDTANARKVLAAAGIKSNVKLGSSGFYMMVKTIDPAKIYAAIKTLEKISVCFRGEQWNGMHLNDQAWAFEIREG